MAFADQLQLTDTIQPAQHAMIDYGSAATFFMLGFKYRDENAAASTLAFVNGAAIVGLSLFTDYPGGVWRKIDYKTHGMIDTMLAAFAGLGPVLFGFGGAPEAKSFYAQAASEAAVVANTDWNAMEPAALPA